MNSRHRGLQGEGGARRVSGATERSLNFLSTLMSTPTRLLRHGGKGTLSNNVFAERLCRSVNSIGRYCGFYNVDRIRYYDSTPDQAYFSQPPFRLVRQALRLSMRRGCSSY
jgi:hypothetical protein